MGKNMLVNVTHVEESRVAILNDGVLEAYEIETINRTQIKGNIYNAVVENVHPSLEAAFLKIAPDLNGFLPLDEVNFNLLPSRGDSRKAGRIGQHLHAGQRIMAQVAREPFAGKPPTVSTYFSLPGRFLVLMPGVDTSGVSRKIEDADQRERLKRITEELKPPEGFGLIVRTAGLGQTKLELQRDLRYLLRLWQSIQRASKGSQFPALVYREADLVIRTIRDHLSADVDEVWIDSKETYNKALAFVTDVMPQRAKILRLYTGDRPLFNKFNLEEQIESIYQRRVTLPSGGEIVIDGTEALTAIDVNTARSRRSGDAEENALQTNVEAASEIARQLRLRDLGGLIVVDFIDMAAAKHKKKVEDAMRAALRDDKARADMTRLSKMGLMEIARQRLKSAKMATTYTTCPTCEGYGLIKNLEVAGLAALRKLQTRTTRGDFGRIRLALPPDVATWMLNNKRDDLAQIERRHGLTIDIQPHPRLKRHETELETFPREEAAAPPPARELAGRPAPALPVEEPVEAPAGAAETPLPELAGAPAEDGSTGDEETAGPDDRPPGPRPERRRRRRRRRRGDRAVEPAAVLPFAAADVGAGPETEDGPEAPSAPRAAAPARHPSGDRAAGAPPRVPRIAPPSVAESEPHVPAPGFESPGTVAGSEPHAPVAESEPLGSVAGSEPQTAESTGRRKRRRRRRGRGQGSAPGVAQEVEDPVIPPSVRSEELMPAAGAGRRGRSSDGRRRRR